MPPQPTALAVVTLRPSACIRRRPREVARAMADRFAVPSCRFFSAASSAFAKASAFASATADKTADKSPLFPRLTSRCLAVVSRLTSPYLTPQASGLKPFADPLMSTSPPPISTSPPPLFHILPLYSTPPPYFPRQTQSESGDAQWHKFQFPTHKLQGSSKVQAPNSKPETAGPPATLPWNLSVWKLELVWSLTFGIWDFPGPWPRAGAFLQILVSLPPFAKRRLEYQEYQDCQEYQEYQADQNCPHCPTRRASRFRA